MRNPEERHEPVRQSVRVDCPIEEAFRLFTERFGEWWPSASGCEMEPWAGGRVLERTASGEERELGTVSRWDPPREVTFHWRADGDQQIEGTVDVEFSVEADGTRVTVIHSNWESAAETPVMLACYSEFVCEQMLVAV